MKQKPCTSPALLVVALCALLFSCAQQKPKIPLAQESVDTWKAMEQQAQGHSPRGQFLLAEPPIVIDRPTQLDADKRTSERKLPETRMSLRMHNADIVAVLQALSRAVGKSFVVSPGVAGVINVNFVERPWDEVFRAILASNKLTYAFDGETIRVMAQADLQGNLDLAAMKRKTQAEHMAALAEEPQVTSVAKVRFADAKMLQKTVESSLSKTRDGKAIGSVQVDELTNSLIIQGVEQDLAKIGKLLAKLDAPRSQIKLKAHIVETTKETARSLGILWGGWYAGKTGGGNNSNLYLSPGGAGTGTSTSTQTIPPIYNPSYGAGISGQGIGVNLPASGVTGSGGTGASLGVMFGNIAGNVLETQLQALENDNKLNIISSPSIATMDNQKAYTESGERVPYQTVTGTGTSATTSVAFQDAVLRLEITPHIIDEEFIKLQVLIQKDEVDSTRAVSGNPYIVKKKTETTLIARNGETVVISGLSKLRNSLREAGIPGVKDIPGAGWLGKSETKADLKDEFMIFITPQVLADWRKGEQQKSFEELHKETTAARREAERRESGEDTAREFSRSGDSTVRLKEMPVETMGGKNAAPAPARAPISRAPEASPPPTYLQDMTVDPAPKSAPAPVSKAPGGGTSAMYLPDKIVEMDRVGAPTQDPAPPARTTPGPAPGTGASTVTIKQMPTMAVPEKPAPAPVEADPVANPAVAQTRDSGPYPVTIRSADPDAAVDPDNALLNARPRKPGLGGRR